MLSPFFVLLHELLLCGTRGVTVQPCSSNSLRYFSLGQSAICQISDLTVYMQAWHINSVICRMAELRQKKSRPKAICWDRTKNQPAVPPGLTCHYNTPTLRIPSYADLCLRRVMLRRTYLGNESCSDCPRKSIRFYVFHCNLTIYSSLEKNW